ncbi:MAG: Rho-type gtpase-activating protein [Trizodia sp. TS-e1964]|nr:MAG: Rho-type gtpase-activating protein [Trizodia sp. TS-e1964]
MESPGLQPDSPMDQDEAAYPCKGCGEILEEGKAFELAGNRWHLNCFRCNTCSTLLDSDANLLLLGDGSLICNNCTYSCNACGNKIEDLAILTGDQAFCASCFRCRNCKRKIENLRYARTSQGIFCMNCHETLMARRRKKSRMAAQQQRTGSNTQSPAIFDKSLPALPPNAAPLNGLPLGHSQFSPDHETSSETYSDTPTELSPRPVNPESRKPSSRSVRRDASPAASESSRKDNLILPSTTYSRNNRSSSVSQRSDRSAGAESIDNTYVIPLAFDPSPALGLPPMPHSPLAEMGSHEPNISKSRLPDILNEGRNLPKHIPSAPRHQPSSPRPSSKGQGEKAGPKGASPHIAYQEKGRTPSSELADSTRSNERSRRLATQKISSTTPPAAPATGGDNILEQLASSPNLEQNGKFTGYQNDQFKLQEVPINKKSAGSRISSSGFDSPASATEDWTQLSPIPQVALPTTEVGDIQKPADASKSLLDINSLRSRRVSQDLRNRGNISRDSSPDPSQLEKPTLPKRGDSLAQPQTKQVVPRKVVPPGATIIRSLSSPRVQQHLSSGTPSTDSSPGLPNSKNDTAGSSDSGEVPSSARLTEPFSLLATEPPPIPPSRSKERPKAPVAFPVDEVFTTPRPSPLPPRQYHQSKDSTSTDHADSPRTADAPLSPNLPHYSIGGEFTMEEDMARIMANGNEDKSTSVLRRVSNAVRHARSHSDQSRTTSPKWVKSPTTSGMEALHEPEISSPTAVTHDIKQENMILKNELRRTSQQLTELQARINSPETGTEIETLNTKLREKRNTLKFLDSQQAVLCEQIDILADYVQKAKNDKNDGKPFDIESLTSEAVRDFARALEKLKDSYGPIIEDLVQQKNQLLEENAQLSKLRDQAIEDTKSLNSRNAQLADLNNELTENIKNRYVANREPSSMNRVQPAFLYSESPKPAQPASSNGLGIYTNLSRDKPESSMDSSTLRPSTAHGASSAASLQEPSEGEPVTVITAPQMVNIRKGQAKKFINWKKGAKGVSKGFKGAFGGNQSQTHLRADANSPESLPYSMLPNENQAPSTSRPVNDPSRQAFGLFGGGKHKQAGLNKPHANGNHQIAGAEHPSCLFGSDLEMRAQYEGRQIPSVVTRCVEEVEVRGMDLEGIYRKTGGNSQVKAVQEGFDKNDDFDISDTDIDITAITSVLKQYFRRLPTPLLTFDVYDRILESNDIHDDEQRVISLRSTFQQLPIRHRECLEFLIFHLARVAAKQKENLMTPKNLAVVFAPTIMRDNDLDREMSDMHSKNHAIQFIIEHNKEIFSTE